MNRQYRKVFEFGKLSISHQFVEKSHPHRKGKWEQLAFILLVIWLGQTPDSVVTSHINFTSLNTTQHMLDVSSIVPTNITGASLVLLAPSSGGGLTEGHGPAQLHHVLSFRLSIHLCLSLYTVGGLARFHNFACQFSAREASYTKIKMENKSHSHINLSK